MSNAGMGSNAYECLRKGDRKSPHPSASSSPASTMTTMEWLPRLVLSRGGGRVGWSGDPCGRLSRLVIPFLAYPCLRERRHLVVRVQSRLDDAHGKYGSCAFAEPQVEVEQWRESHVFKHQAVSLFDRAMPGKQVIANDGLHLYRQQSRRA